MPRDNLHAIGDLAHIVADAVVSIANEHGVPNSFMPSELVAYHMRGAYVLPMQVGRAAPLAVSILRQRGWTVEYSNRHFTVDKGGKGYDD